MAKTHIKILSQRFDDAAMCLRIDSQTILQEVYQAPDSPELLCQTLSGSVSWQKRSAYPSFIHLEMIYSR